MAEPIRIANCSGFYGDRLAAAREMVEGGPIDVLTGDWLAELTMLILARLRDSGRGGYARTFLTQLEQVMGPCIDRGIKVVSNAGGLDPRGCAEAVASIAERLGLAPTIACVEGDDLLPRAAELVASGELVSFPDGGPFGATDGLVSANAYLGCWGVVDALERGADIVVTGRTIDAALVCAPAAWHHGWRRDDWDRLAGAVVAGHVIECGTQATGGNYSFFREVPGMERVGFPWVEIAADGSSVVGKHDGTGGEVSVGTVTSQLLYEIAGPRYLGPDVTARFDTIAVEQTAADRVRLSGVRGEPPPATLKVATNRNGGYRVDLAVGLTGLDVEAKAELVERAFWLASPYRRDEFADVTVRLDRTDTVDPATNAEAVAEWRLILKDPDQRKVGRAVSGAFVELGLATIPGFFALSGAPGEARAYGVYRPASVPARLVPQAVTVLGGDTGLVESIVESAVVASAATPPDDLPDPAAVDAGRPEPDGAGRPTARTPLGTVAGARSGDKGGDANLGVFARDDAGWAWLDGFLTTERLAELLPEVAPLPIERFRFPNLRAVNFVIRGLLGEGVASSTRQDGQAKSLGEWLRARVVDVPAHLLR